MQIDELSKSQIVLLTLLVSFITSIATGIVTVSLMDQAPPAITQSVDRIIERTVEKVVPGQAAAVVTTKTVVVKESELISQAVEAVASSVTRIYTGTSTESTFLGFGIVLDGGGTIATDLEVLGTIENAYAIRSDGSASLVSVRMRNDATGIAHLAASTTATWTPARLAGGSGVLGQTVITLTGKTATRIQDGIITAVTPSESGVPIIDTNIVADWILPGGVLVNADGEVIGMSTVFSRSISKSAFVPASAFWEEPKKEVVE